MLRNAMDSGSRARAARNSVDRLIVALGAQQDVTERFQNDGFAGAQLGRPLQQRDRFVLASIHGGNAAKV